MKTITLGDGASVTLSTAADRDDALIAACAELAVLEQDGADTEHAARIAELRRSIAATPTRTEEAARARAAIIASPAGAATMPYADAEVVEAAGSIIDFELDYLRLFHGPTRIGGGDAERDAAADALWREGRQFAPSRILATRRATSLVGWRAKAIAALTADVDLFTGPHDPAEAIVASLVADLVGDYDPIKVAEGTAPPAILGAAVVHPDAELIALCQEYEATDRQWCDLLDAVADAVTPEAEHAAEAAVAPVRAALDVQLDRLVEMRARTSDGVVARAKLLHVLNGDFGFSFDGPDTGTICPQMLGALMRDAAALAGMPA